MCAVGGGRFLLPLLLLIVLPHETQGLDGCPSEEGVFSERWRCNDVCIYEHKDCKCGDETFGINDLKWCCNGVTLNLGKSCDGRCNFYGNDTGRSAKGERAFVPLICDGNETTCVKEGTGSTWDGDYKQTICAGNSSCDGELTWCQEEERKKEKCGSDSRDFVRCPGIRSNKKAGNSTKSISGQCVEKVKLGDRGAFECLDRSDEDPLQETKNNVTNREASFVDFSRLKNCTGKVHGVWGPGLECGEQKDFVSPCVAMYYWCQDWASVKCPVLGPHIRTNNPKICANTTFWRHQKCGKFPRSINLADSSRKLEDLIRCRGSWNGQCVPTSLWGRKGAKDVWGFESCRDKSDLYRLIKQTMKEGHPPDESISNQTRKTKVGNTVYENESNQFKDPPIHTSGNQSSNNQTWKTAEFRWSYEDKKRKWFITGTGSNPFKIPSYQTLPDHALSNSNNYAKDKTTNLMMAAPTEETCRENEGFVCKVRF